VPPNPPSTENAFRPAHATREAAWGLMSTILLTVWAGELSVPLAERYMKDLARLQREVPPRSIGGSIALVVEGAPIPSSEARAILARVPTNGNVINVGTAIVIEGEGFRASAARAVVTGIGMMNRVVPLRAFSNLEQAIADLGVRVNGAGGTMPPAETLAGAMRVLREACARAV